jgi:hypothetical protein
MRAAAWRATRKTVAGAGGRTVSFGHFRAASQGATVAAVRRPIVLGATLAAAAAVAGLAVASLRLYSHAAVLTQFGYVTSVAPKGSAYTLRFDPALWLEGQTANAAAVEDGVVKPGEPVPNDYYIRNPDRELLTFKLPANADVTVLVDLQTTKITVAKLAQLLATKSKYRCTPYELRLPCRLGFWLTYRIDRVMSLNQQYQP